MNRISIILLSCFFVVPPTYVNADPNDAPVNIILGRPTADSVTMNLLASDSCSYFVEYGRISGNLNKRTGITDIRKNEPIEIKLNGLLKDSQYYYRINWRNAGRQQFFNGSEHAFHTQRAPGKTFVFTVDADYHRDKPSNPAEIKVTFQNILREQPDFDIDLGDTFMCEKFAQNYAEVIARYAEDRQYFGIFGNSVPLYLCMGNHDGETGYLFDGTENNIPTWAAKARKLYYVNPFPDGFYTGNTQSEPFVGTCQNYYSWNWGSALFVVLDSYRYTMQDRKQTGDFWDWTLGEAQYKWFKNTLETSKAKYKFVFIHQLLGEVRGGIEWADKYEWGGYDKKGIWQFNEKRPGWGQPIHQLMKANNVTILFRGHDHFYAKQELDGIVYQEVPQPSARNGSKQKAEQQAHEYSYKSGVLLQSPGHLKVAVSETGIVVDYIHTSLSSDNNQIMNSYTIQK